MDKNQVEKKALPLIVLHELYTTRSTMENIAIDQLCIGTVFLQCDRANTFERPSQKKNEEQ